MTGEELREPARRFCHKCFGAGRVMVAVTPPGGTTKMVFTECPDCSQVENPKMYTRP
jgi:hypothetical protein